MINHIGQTTPRRRQVAVLFADICGFTRLVESAEPEAVYRIMRPLLDDLVGCVHAYGGEVQQVLGDGFMAVFGLRRSLGDEGERATAAACAMLRAGRPGRPDVHVGVECGEVLVSPSWQSASFGVWGRAVTVAARLCDLAGPSTVYVGPQAARRGGERILKTWADGFTTIVHARLKGMAQELVVHGATWPSMQQV